MARIRMYNMMMRDETQIIDLDDLREFFDLESLLEDYYKNKQLYEWLRTRGYTEQANDIDKLDPDSSDFEKGFYTALGVKDPYGMPSRSLKEIETDFGIMKALPEASKALFLANRIQIAKNSDEAKNIATKYDTVYLIEEKYNIELTEKDTKFIGIGKGESDVTLIGLIFCKNNIDSLFEHCKLENYIQYLKEEDDIREEFRQTVEKFLRTQQDPEKAVLPNDIKSIGEQLNNRGFNTNIVVDNVRKTLLIPVLKINKHWTQSYSKGWYRGNLLGGDFKEMDGVTLIYGQQNYKTEGTIKNIREMNDGKEVQIEVTFSQNDPYGSWEPTFLVKGKGITVGHGLMEKESIYEGKIEGVVKEGFFYINENVFVKYADSTNKKAKINYIWSNASGHIKLYLRNGERGRLGLMDENENNILIDDKVVSIKKVSEWTEPA